MPRELTAAEESAWSRYQALGTPDEVEAKLRSLSKARKEAATYRERAKELADGAPVVPEGGRILTKAEAEEFDALAALGKAADLKAKLDRTDELQATLEARDREAARDKAAKALGIEGSDLAPFAGADALSYEVREQEVSENGQTVRKSVAYVKDAEGKEHELSAYGKQAWGRAFEAVLGTAKQNTRTEGSGGGTSYTPQTGGGSKGGSADPIEARIKRMQEQAAARTNPLLPTTT